MASEGWRVAKRLETLDGAEQQALVLALNLQVVQAELAKVQQALVLALNDQAVQAELAKMQQALPLPAPRVQGPYR